MQLQKNDTNFGMAFISPTAKEMPYFKRYLAQATGKIDTKALGEFVVKQSKNNKVDMCYKHTANGDVFEVFADGTKKIIPIKSGTPASEKTGFLQKAKEWYKNKTEKFEYNPEGSWENLPAEMKEAGEVANKMEKELA